jgi:hypothetical protein
MIFGGPLDHETWRYSSWDDAETGHPAAVKKRIVRKCEDVPSLSAETLRRFATSPHAPIFICDCFKVDTLDNVKSRQRPFMGR